MFILKPPLAGIWGAGLRNPRHRPFSFLPLSGLASRSSRPRARLCVQVTEWSRQPQRCQVEQNGHSPPEETFLLALSQATSPLTAWFP